MTKLFESSSHILICSDYADPAEHHHMAAHIILALEETMTVLSGGMQTDCRGIMIPSGFAHRINTHQRPALVFLFDNTTDISSRIQNIRVLSEADCNTIFRLYSAFESTGLSGSYRSLEKHILALLGLEETGCCVTDERILAAMKIMRSRLSEPLSCQDVADAVFLSQSRFSHLFRQQVGMTFSAYLIYQRILCVYTGILAGTSITEAALEAGFSSSTHFAEVNRRLFGLSASSITKNMLFTKIQ